MFNKKNKNILGGKRYKINRTPKYRNPSRLKRRKKVASVFFYINILLVIAICYFAWFFVFSKYFFIDNIIVQGTEKISSYDIIKTSDNYLDEKRFLIMNNRNLIIMSKKGLITHLNESFIFNNLKINKQFPNTLILTINEKTPALEFSSNGKNYFIDPTGLVIQRVFGRESFNGIYKLKEGEETDDTMDSSGFSHDKLPLLYDSNNDQINLGEKVINDQDLIFLNNFLEKSKNYGYLNILKIQMPGKFAQYFEVLNNPNNWLVQVNFKDDLDKQLKRLDLIINEQIKPDNLGGVDYIDLRMGENVYYKSK